MLAVRRAHQDLARGPAIDGAHDHVLIEVSEIPAVLTFVAVLAADRGRATPPSPLLPLTTGRDEPMPPSKAERRSGYL